VAALDPALKRLSNCLGWVIDGARETLAWCAEREHKDLSVRISCEQIPAAATDEVFSDSVLPMTVETRLLGLNTKAPDDAKRLAGSAIC
jgi:hypothetical protein